MGTCRKCCYGQTSAYKVKDKDVSTTCCELTHRVMKPDVWHDCPCFNKDLSEYDICYNCRYYGGGSDWGLFCSHNEKYHHLGSFNDKPCEFYERKEQ